MNADELLILDTGNGVCSGPFGVSPPYLDDILDLRPKRSSIVKQLSSPARSFNYCLGIPRHFDTDQVRNMDLKIQDKNSPITKDDFHIMLDVHHFKPDEIKVKVVDDHVVVTGEHEIRRDDHGWVSRQFSRRYPLPKNVNVDGLTCKLCSNGLLIIVAPKMLEDETVRTLPIEYTGKPFLNKKKEKLKTFQQSDEEK